MKKIVTIDFDIIMAPSINLYNNIVPANDWETLKNAIAEFQKTNPKKDPARYKREIFGKKLLEIIEKEPKIANKLFVPNNGQNNLNINNINYFYNYSFTKGDFVRYKFKDEKSKSFNEDTIIIF